MNQLEGRQKAITQQNTGVLSWVNIKTKLILAFICKMRIIVTFPTAGGFKTDKKEKTL